MKRIAVVLAVMALMLPVQPASAGFPCRGFSPVVPDCQASGVLAAVNCVVIDVDYGFTGRVSVVLDTGLGRYSAQATYLFPYLFEPVRRQSVSGTLIPGSPYVMSVRTSMAVDGTDTPVDSVQVPGMAVGGWEVRVEPTSC